VLTVSIVSGNGSWNEAVGGKWEWELSLIMGTGWYANRKEVIEVGIRILNSHTSSWNLASTDRRCVQMRRLLTTDCFRLATLAH